MQGYAFSTELEKSLKKESVVEIERWLRGFKDLEREMDLKLVHLGRYFDSIPNHLKNDYLNTLLNVLESVPSDCKINTTTTLTERLMTLPQSINDESLKGRLQEALRKLGAA